MLKAIFLDMDETLCDTKKADVQAQIHLATHLSIIYPSLDARLFCQRFVDGFYKRINHEFPQLLSLISNELSFRLALIQHLFNEQGIEVKLETSQEILDKFNQFRIESFGFFDEIEDALIRLKQKYKIIVITNGPTFSQRPKIEGINLANYVDHILVGGEEPEEKPALSIFQKALELADCRPEEAIHAGDNFECDIKGASNANIASIWLCSEQAKQDNPQANIATYIIHSASDIEKTIEEHANFLLKK